MTRGLLLCALAAAAAFGCSDPPDRAGQARDVADEAGLPDDVGDLLALAATATAATYQVTYEITAEGGDDTVVVAQAPPRRLLRVDYADGDADATIHDGTATYACSRIAGRWTCAVLADAPTAGGAFDQGVVDSVTATLAADADRYDFAVTDEVVAGADAACLRATPKPGAGPGTAASRLCVSTEGAILLAETPAQRLEAVAYSTEVPADAFELPAAPGTPGS